jgi:hypothetical protein
LPTFVVCGVFDVRYSNRSEVETQCGFDFISFMARDGEQFFMCILAIWISSFENALFSSVAHFFISSLIWGEFIF